ncbi:MAG: hypothetical protein HYW65_04040 [Candidatus Liptonbacteria bacterium]|nr:hypothetical protein [Candidatus Liptonbacteria bacterium]
MQQQSFLLTPGFWTSAHGVLNWIFLILDVVLLCLFFYAFKEILPFRFPVKVGKRQQNIPTSPQVAVFRERWQIALNRFDPNSPEAMRLAIFEADMLADAVLKEYGIEGENLTDRLSKLTPEALSCLNRLWNAHRFRNELAGSMDRETSPEEAKEALDTYEAFLKEVKILL